MKYIILDKGGLEILLIFPESVNHRDMVSDSEMINKRVISAGFVTFHVESRPTRNVVEATCFGESKSLGVKWRQDVDSELVSRMFSKY